MDARLHTCDICCQCGHTHSATSAHVDLAIDNNGTWSDAFQFGTPGDTTWTLTGQSFSLDLQITYYDAVPMLSIKSSAGQIIIDDPIQRVIHMNVSPAAIQAALTPGMYVYDLLMQDGSTPPIVVPLMHGTLCINQGVTGVT